MDQQILFYYYNITVSLFLEPPVIFKEQNQTQGMIIEMWDYIVQNINANDTIKLDFSNIISYNQ
jgi:hypothetical protein